MSSLNAMVDRAFKAQPLWLAELDRQRNAAQASLLLAYLAQDGSVVWGFSTVVES